MKDIWELMEEPPQGCESVASLWNWSLNFSPGEGPAALFLDIIGWSIEHLGQPLFDFTKSSLGYMEIDKLAAALVQFAEHPSSVTKYVNDLLEAESR